MTVQLAEGRPADLTAISVDGVRVKPNRATLGGTILVHVPTRGEPAALRIAVDIAKNSDASVLGVCAEAFEPALFAGMEYTTHSLMEAWLKALDERLAHAKGDFERATSCLGRAAYWASEEEYPQDALVRHACGADWVVAVRPHAAATLNVTPPVADLILRMGLPVVLAPDHAKPLEARRIVVGWSPTPEASRAISDAMPLLIAADQVVVVTVSPEPQRGEDEEGLSEVCRRLERRGCKVVRERHASSRASIASVLCKAAEGHGADLLVVGGYAHSRLQEWILGGVTRDLIASCPHYVLFSH
jgi:nucleotide-binding universal stress UspA family protein